jgi:hypothetical protein
MGAKMTEEEKDCRTKKLSQESKGISRRQLITGMTSGAVSVGVFGNAAAQILATLASNIESISSKSQQKEPVSSQTKKPPH